MRRILKKQKGFTLIELMIVVAIIGILAAVSIPAYMKHIQKSRFTALVFPNMHSIENQIAIYYAATGVLPSNSNLAPLLLDADTTHFNVWITTSPGGTNSLALRVASPPGNNKLSKLQDEVMYAMPRIDDGKISGWALSGTLAINLGLQNE